MVDISTFLKPKFENMPTVELNNASQSCILRNEEGSVLGEYPYVWLRDNCRCSQCFHPSPSLRIRFGILENLDPDIIPTNVEINATDEKLMIEWPDKHMSQFQFSWLQKIQFSKSPKDPVSDPSEIFWGKEMQHKVPTFTYNGILESDESLHDWIESLQVYGLALLKEAPKQEGALDEIGNRIAFLRRTSYGEKFTLESKYKASNFAFTNTKMGLHTDLANYENAPNVQMLHCITQARGGGGENQLCDGFNVADILRQKNPDIFHILSTTSIDLRGTDFDNFHLQFRRPIIALNPDSSYKAINYSDQGRAPNMTIPVEDVNKVYKALKVWHTEINNEENKIEIKLEDGEILSFNNQRLLHGRNSFIVTETSKRHYQGAYVDWDELRYRMRVIREKMFGLKPL